MSADLNAVEQSNSCFCYLFSVSRTNSPEKGTRKLLPTASSCHFVQPALETEREGKAGCPGIDVFNLFWRCVRRRPSRQTILEPVLVCQLRRLRTQDVLVTQEVSEYLKRQHCERWQEARAYPPHLGSCQEHCWCAAPPSPSLPRVLQKKKTLQKKRKNSSLAYMSALICEFYQLFMDLAWHFPLWFSTSFVLLVIKDTRVCGWK